MKGEAYERYLRDIFRDEGLTASLTPRTNDKGIDILVEEGPQRIAVQAKHYQPGNKVGSTAVQQAAGLLARPDITDAMVVTTSSFTQPAREVAQNRGVILRRVGYNPTNSTNDASEYTMADSSEHPTESQSSDVNYQYGPQLNHGGANNDSRGGSDVEDSETGHSLTSHLQQFVVLSL